MKYVQINSVPHGSTGNVMFRTKHEREEQGDECWAVWGRGRAAENDHEFNFGNKPGFYLDVLQTRLDGHAGFHSKRATKKLLAKLDEINPDVVHLHNIHGYYVNIEMLFNWLAVHSCQVKWTLHDCWAFTGHCAYFTYVKCAQWKTHCAYDEPCCQLHTYPKTYSKHSCAKNYEEKRRIFSSIPTDRMTLITPSYWLEGLVKESFLKDYPVVVKHNTIDKTIFKPTASDFRERYGIGNRFMILGVASPWTERKGLNDFVKLANVLDSEKYAIVLIGLNKKQIRKLSKILYAFTKIENNESLAEIYSTADVFLHPGIEETYGMTVAEAQACGTATIVSKGSACEEAASDYPQLLCSIDMNDLVPTIVKLGGGGDDFDVPQN